jgi:four helix bundle protein
LEETSYWLELLTEAEIIKPELLSDLMQEADELSAIFTTCIKNAKQKEQER